MPRDLPLWELLITDLGNPPAARVARALGVGVSSVYRWNKTGRAPRMACLALFWLTSWGRSQVNTDAVNDAVMCAQLARSWREQAERLEARLLLAQPLPSIRPPEAQAAPAAGRDSAATGCASHTDSAPAGRLPAPAATAAPALDWPELWPSLEPLGP